MQVPIGCRAKVVTGVLSLLAVCLPDLLYGQQMADRFHLPSGIGATVSVATLRIPEKAWKHFARAKDAAEHNHLAECDRETAKAIEIAPDFAAAYLLRADSEVQEHSYEAAIANVKEARRVEPDVMWAGVVLAGAYNGLRQYEEARLALSAVRGAEAGTWQAAYERTRAAIGARDIEQALRWSLVALESAPASFTDARVVRANALIVARRWSEAQAQLEIYLQSKAPQEHRTEVMTALNYVKGRAREEELQKLASR